MKDTMTTRKRRDRGISPVGARLAKWMIKNGILDSQPKLNQDQVSATLTLSDALSDHPALEVAEPEPESVSLWASTSVELEEAYRVDQPLPEDLDTLAEKIRGMQLSLWSTCLEHARAIGKLLSHAKTLLKHGEFGLWVEQNCHLSRSAAAGYMRVAERWHELPGHGDGNVQSIAQLTLSKALRVLSVPKVNASSTCRPHELLVEGTETTTGVTDDKEDCNGADPGVSRAGRNHMQTPPVGRAAEVHVAQSNADSSHAGSSTTPGHREDAILRRQRARSNGTPAEAAAPDASQSRGTTAAETTTSDHVVEANDDEQWLKLLPLRSQLADPVIFDQDALLWLKTRLVVEKLLQIYTPTPAELERAVLRCDYYQRFGNRLAVLTGIRPPTEWKLCVQCKGQFTDRLGTIPCSICAGKGYEITDVGKAR